MRRLASIDELRRSAEPFELAAWMAAQAQPRDDPDFVGWSVECGVRCGRGVRIGLLDSGLRWAHPLFARANIQGRDFTGSGNLGSSSGHGTVSAALLVADGWYRGLTTGATLVFAKVLGARDARRTRSAIARAVRWAAHEGAQVIAMPFGSASYCDDVVRAVREAQEAGSVIFAASGREHGVAAFPATLPGVVSVGAVGRCMGSGRPDVRTWGTDVPAANPDPTLATGSSVATVLAAALHILRQYAAPQP
ncbi:MAG: S8 family serine peptidase [Acidobacteria bacterium]|nr:S8 family serine peptidase [Acidobacteriota bacterium]